MTNRSKLEALRASKLAVELSPEQCAVLAELIDFRDLKAGDVLSEGADNTSTRSSAVRLAS
jgi:hypothetical protein